MLELHQIVPLAVVQMTRAQCAHRNLSVEDLGKFLFSLFRINYIPQITTSQRVLHTDYYQRIETH